MYLKLSIFSMFFCQFEQDSKVVEHIQTYFPTYTVTTKTFGAITKNCLVINKSENNVLIRFSRLLFDVQLHCSEWVSSQPGSYLMLDKYAFHPLQLYVTFPSKMLHFSKFRYTLFKSTIWKFNWNAAEKNIWTAKKYKANSRFEFGFFCTTWHQGEKYTSFDKVSIDTC